MKKLVITVLIIVLVLLGFITGCSDSSVEVRKGNGLQQEVTGSAVAIDYAEADIKNKSLGEVN